MEQNWLQQFENIVEDAQITLDDLPDIDLYMDQVIQIFENKLEKTKRNQDEKILTKTMINNYAKGKLFFPIKNKKYTKKHLILISLIYQLKGALQLADIKTVLTPLNEKIVQENFDLEPLYTIFLHHAEKNTVQIKKDARELATVIQETVEKMDESDAEYLVKMLLICTFAHKSNMYRRMAEHLVDRVAKKEKN